MADLLLATKLYVPRAHPRLVARPRLVDKLDQVMERRVCLLSASAGSGKTTLLSGWIALHPTSVAWLSLDESDNDAVRFLGYVIAALQTVNSSIGKRALAVLQSPQPAPIESLLQPPSTPLDH
jgi:LuxR family maltose regulon positive regulatory protein